MSPGTSSRTAIDALDWPATLDALSVKSYEVLLLKPATVQEVVLPPTEQTAVLFGSAISTAVT